jgi:hypothetical protein
LYYDFTACSDGGSYCPWHIFADNWREKTTCLTGTGATPKRPRLCL